MLTVANKKRTLSLPSLVLAILAVMNE